jgi:AraC family transcriptional regulator
MDQARSHSDWFKRDPAFATVPREIRPVGGTGTSLIQVRQQPGGYYARDGAPEFTLTLLERVSGRGKVTYGGDMFEVSRKPGDCLMAPPDTALAYEPEAPSDLLIFLIPKQVVGDTLAEHGRHLRAASFGRLHTGTFRDTLVMALGQRLWQETAEGDPLGALFVGQAVRTLVLALFRAAGEHLATTLPERGGLAPWQARRVCDYLHVHLDENVSLDALAGLVGLSPAHFCRAFKQSMGLPPHRWHLLRRMEQAQALLADTSLPVIEIAAQVGYDDPNQLARVFRKQFGISPGRYRRERKN